MTPTPAPLPALPDPMDWCYEWDGPYGTRKFGPSDHFGRKYDRAVALFNSDQMRAYARAAIAAQPAPDALKDMEARKDAAYLERNQVVAALAKAYPSGVARTAIDGWSADWHGCVYIDLPTGQASWHFHDSQAYLFADLPPYTGKWDGHDTPEKYRRLAALPAAHAQQPATLHQVRELEDEVHALRQALKARPAHAQQPAPVALTDAQIDSINRSTEWPAGSLATIGDRQWLLLFRHAARAIERAHGIPAPTTDTTGEQQ